ncbi:MAG TPA: hypothetical protein VJN93_09225 [Candidatus Acidoferrum sp.]|nr:hypothetical protein [Candidatus Acidoferrum sp.]
MTSHLQALQRLPLSFLPSLLREAIEYDYKFPAERRALEKELENLSSLTPEQLKEWFQAFADIRLSAQLESFDWVNQPAQFVEQLSTYLWGTHQLDAFRAAALGYAAKLQAAIPPEAPILPRVGISVIGQGVDKEEAPLFRKLRPHGAYFSSVQPENGLRVLLEAVAARAKKQSVTFGHWYIDGGQEAEHDPALTCVSYHALASARAALSNKIRTDVGKPGMGPEMLRTLMAQMLPADLGMKRETGAGSHGGESAVLERFQVKVLTEGSGTQIFSTTFAQWAAREALRRAQPLTMLVRFAPRQRQKPMNEMLEAADEAAELDPMGSLVDGDMGAYYNWVNQQRLPGAEQSSFLVWFENHSQAVVIGPTVPRGTESSAATDVANLLKWII